jgi:hypothetical protein
MVSLTGSNEASPGTSLEAIFNEANSMPAVERWYFSLNATPDRTSEVKGRSHFSHTVCDKQMHSVQLAHHRRAHQKLEKQRASNEFLNVSKTPAIVAQRYPENGKQKCY